MAKALVAATAIVTDVHVTADDALVCDTGDMRLGYGTATVILCESSQAKHTPALSSTERTSPTVSVQARALEAFWREKG